MPNPPSPMQVFESSLGASLSLVDNPDHERAEPVDALIQETLRIAHRMVLEAEPGSNEPGQTLEPDLWDEIGAFMLRTSAIMAEFTARLQDAEPVHQAAKEKLLKAKEHNHLARMSVLETLDGKKKMFQRTSDLSAQYHKDLQTIWSRKDPAMPADAGRSNSSMSPYQDGLDFGSNASHRSRSRRTLPAGGQRDQRALNDQGSASEASDDSDDELFQQVDMGALANRGKGTYQCPKGKACKKGGVDKDGNLVAFERNSSFVQHCNKHRKPFRCEQENCPNPPKKRKFARRDGLERHRNTVSHQPPSPGHQGGFKHTSVKIEST